VATDERLSQRVIVGDDAGGKPHLYDTAYTPAQVTRAKRNARDHGYSNVRDYLASEWQRESRA
jgi:hypothetical protein